MSRPKNTNTAKILWGVIFLAILTLTILKLSQGREQSISYEWTKRNIEISGKTYNVYEAKTPLELEAGLSQFNSIQNNEGMLFYFDNPGKPAFWMKNMKFSIDIIWLRDYQVVQIDKKIPYGGANELKKYYSASDINQVLELNAGEAERGNIKIGDMLQLN